MLNINVLGLSTYVFLSKKATVSLNNIVDYYLYLKSGEIIHFGGNFVKFPRLSAHIILD